MAAFVMCAQLPAAIEKVLANSTDLPEFLYRGVREDGLDVRSHKEALERAKTALDFPRESVVHHAADGCKFQL